jgi:hypothetical protein
VKLSYLSARPRTEDILIYASRCAKSQRLILSLLPSVLNTVYGIGNIDADFFQSSLGLEAGTGKMAVDGRRLVAGPALDGRNGGAVPAGPATGSSRPDGTYLLPLLNIHCLDIYGLCTTI